MPRRIPEGPPGANRQLAAFQKELAHHTMDKESIRKSLKRRGAKEPKFVEQYKILAKTSPDPGKPWIAPTITLEPGSGLAEDEPL